MQTLLRTTRRDRLTPLINVLDRDNRWEVQYSDAGFYRIQVRSLSTEAVSVVPTSSSVVAIRLLKENLSAPAFAQAGWALLRFSTQLVRDHARIRLRRRA